VLREIEFLFGPKKKFGLTALLAAAWLLHLSQKGRVAGTKVTVEFQGLI